MNLKRGLLRIWLVLTAAWLIGGFAMVWTDGQSLYPNDFAYLPDSDTFNAYDYREREALNRLAETGIMVSLSFPDRSSLFVHRDLDADSLAKRFWQEREENRAKGTEISASPMPRSSASFAIRKRASFCRSIREERRSAPMAARSTAGRVSAVAARTAPRSSTSRPIRPRRLSTRPEAVSITNSGSDQPRGAAC